MTAPTIRAKFDAIERGHVVAWAHGGHDTAMDVGSMDTPLIAANAFIAAESPPPNTIIYVAENRGYVRRFKVVDGIAVHQAPHPSMNSVRASLYGSWTPPPGTPGPLLLDPE